MTSAPATMEPVRAAAPPRRRLSPARTNLWVDALLLVAVLLALAPILTGLPIHEWLSLGLWAGVVLHLLLHWDWTLNALRRIVSRFPAAARLNLWLAFVLFVDMTAVMLSGVLISRVALPALGIDLRGDRTWTLLHRLSADWLVFLVGLHVALHWRWILTTIRRFVVDPLAGVVRPRPAPGGEAAR